MSERPIDPTERTGPIEPVDAAHVEHVETTHTDPVAGTRVQRVETTTEPVSSTQHEYASNLGPSIAEERQQRGILFGVLGGVAILLLLAILWFVFLAPGRSSGGGQTNVNVGAGQSQQPAQDLQLNVNLTQQARLATTPASRPPTAAATARPASTTPAAAPPVVAPPATDPAVSAPAADAPAAAASTQAPPPAQPQPATAAPASGSSSGQVVNAGQPPSGWQTVMTQNRSCQFAAPPDWQIRGESARAPSDRATAAIQSQPMSSWTDFKNAAKGSQAGATAREDSDTRLWLERAQPSGSVQHYIARPAGSSACVLQLDVTRDGVSPLESTIRQMADTLGAPR